MEILGVLPQIVQQLRDQNAVSMFFNIRGCIHIGAHWGQEYPLYKQMGLDNLIFYEAVESTFDVLKTKVGPEVDLRNTALGNTSGTMEMFIEESNDGCSSSMLEPDHHLKQYPHITFPKKLEVPITKLDDESFDRETFNFINMDVQGFELEVLKGAEKTLDSVDLLLCEINKAEMYKGCAKVEDLEEYLKDFGFIRISTYWQQDGGTYGDGLYFNKSRSNI